MGDLTTKALVKSRLGIAHANFDTVIDEIIDHVSADMETRMNRTIAEATYTEYYDGTGTNRLILRQGPLVTVTSVNSVSYTDAGDGSRTETLTELLEANRLDGGKLADGHRGAAEIIYPGGTFSAGYRNWKVVYKAGWATLPDALVRWATWFACQEFRAREAQGMISVTIGEGTFSLISPKQLDDRLERAIAPYKLLGVA